MYRAREFSQLAGVTVRTLHHYDRLGLLRPARRTEAGYRLYEARDMERLEQIVALKYLGLPLKQIRTLLDRAPVGLPNALRTQRRLLEEKRTMLDRAIQAIGDAESKLRINGAAPPVVLRNIIEVMQMESNQDWMTKYGTEEGRAKIQARKHLWSPELQERVSRQWNELIADVEAALAEDPAGEKAQALAARWNGLVEEFTNRDKDIEQSVSDMWADRENWPASLDRKAPVIKTEVWKFIARANAASGYSSR
jgi:DNA-binding transcriptional MerR regulator